MNSLLGRIERAKYLFFVLKSINEDFLSQKPFGIKIEENSETKRRIYSVNDIPNPDSYMNQMIILGDILHNLRSALDNLAYRLGELSNIVDLNKVYFPFGNDFNDYCRKRGNKLEGIKQDLIDIIDSVKPYRDGGNKTLWQLNKLNNIDKHRFILSAGGSFSALDLGTISMNMFQEQNLKNPENEDLNFGNVFSFYVKPAEVEFPIQRGTIVFDDSIKNPIDKNMVEKCRFLLAFNEEGIIEGIPIIDGMTNFINEVEKVVHRFDKFIK